MKLARSVLATAAVLALAACGESKLDRGLSGAAIGAGTGAAASTITGGSMTSGALLGGALGGAAGVLTREKDVDLGTPLWRR